MAETTLTRYLKLRLAADLSADARYNLQRIDSLGETFITDAVSTLQVRSASDIVIEPESPDVGGTPTIASPGSLSFGTASHDISITAYSALFRVRSSLSLLNSTGTNPDTYLTVTPDGEDVDVELTLSLGGSNRSITVGYDGTLVTEDATQSLTNKTITGTFTGPLTGNVTGNVTGILTGTVIGTADNITAISNNTLITLSSLSLPGSQVTGDIGGNADNVTGTVAIVNGGTGATSADAALVNLLPSYVNSGTLKVKSDGSGLEWVVGAGQGTVTGVTASAPLSITGDANLTPNVTISQATSSVNGYLSSTDWTTFNSKEPLIPAGTTGQYWRGDKSWQTLDKAAVGLSNVDNTSDVNKPISSAVSTALSGKEPTITAGTTNQYWRGDKSWQTLDTLAVTENTNLYFTDTRARTAAVLNSTAGNETDQAPSVSAMKSYVSAQGGGSVGYTWATADGVTKTITHSLNKTTIGVEIYDENGETILVDTIDRTSSNAVSLTSSVAPTGDWTVIIRP
jgi:hypothetical protein